MSAWEYRIVTIDRVGHNVEDELGKIGRDGWELVTRETRAGGRKIECTFKRRCSSTVRAIAS